MRCASVWDRTLKFSDTDTMIQYDTVSSGKQSKEKEETDENPWIWGHVDLKGVPHSFNSATVTFASTKINESSSDNVPQGTRDAG